MKKIKFPLEMKDGVMVRTIEELRENFDAERLVEHYESGKLEIWLENRYYKEELQKILALDPKAKDFLLLLCDCLGIRAQEEEIPDFLKRRVEKFNHLKGLTEDKLLLGRVDDIAITQEDFIDLLDSGKSEIYLCEGDFTVPVSAANKTYIGIFNPTAVIRAVDNVNFKEQKIIFKDMDFIWDVSGLTPRDRSYQAEELFRNGQYEKAADICRELVKEDNPRALMLLYQITSKYLCDAKEAAECRDRGVRLHSIHSLIEKGKWQFVECYKEKLKELAESGMDLDKLYYDLALGQTVSSNEEAGSDREELDRAIRNHYEKVRKKEADDSEKSIDNFYREGCEVPQDYEKALEWFQKAITAGNPWAMEMVVKGLEEEETVSKNK